MLDFHAALFVIVMGHLSDMTAIIVALNIQGFGNDSMSHVREQFREPLSGLVREIDKLPFSPVTNDMLQRFVRRIETEDQMTLNMAAEHTKVIRNAILVDMTEAWFLMVPATRRHFYLEREPFGEAVITAFPNATFDIIEAGKSIALDRWTAAVFHLMRVVEHGLRALAVLVEIPMAAEVEFEQWRNVIDQIQKQIRAMEQETRTPERTARLRVYADAASQCWFFKEAWRNHVSHSRSKYVENEALEVWDHVRSFMQRLAVLRQS